MDFPATNSWSDEYLRNHHGSAQVKVDTVKIENRYAPAEDLALAEFLDVYNETNAYLIDTLPKEMSKDFNLPDCLLCGGFTERLQEFVIWFNSGGSKSHLHMDTVENINCMVSGSKQWFLVDKENTDKIIMDQKEGDYCSVDVDKVDMVKYPFLQTLPWWNVTVEQGDCLYVPHGWGHQVSSSNSRNIAINIWWAPMTSFNANSCNDLSKDQTLHSFNYTPAEQYRFQLLQLLKNNKGSVNYDLMHSKVVSEHSGQKLISLKDFLLLDKNKDDIITTNEIQTISLKNLE